MSLKIVIILAFIVILKIVLNTFRYLATKHYYMIYSKALREKNFVQICRYVSPIGVLFEKAGTERTVTVHINHNTYNTEISTQLNDSYFSKEIIETFEMTLGVYLKRIRESVYPLYWLNLPLIALESYNLTIPFFLKIPIKIIYWSISVAAAYFLEETLDNYRVIEKVQELLHNL